MVIRGRYSDFRLGDNVRLKEMTINLFHSCKLSQRISSDVVCRRVV
jgi:hypothetical protein